MSTTTNASITNDVFNDLGTFLAHSVTLELDAAERCFELAAMMLTHNNLPLNALFLELARHSVEHADEVEQIAKDYELPQLKPWEYQWPNNESPESIGFEDTHYRMTPWEALQSAYAVEKGAEQFYRDIANQTANDQVRVFATQFADEEAEHAEAVTRAMQPYNKDSAVDQRVDLDPPGMPE